MTTPLRFALIGAGSIAKTHAEALARVAGARLVAVHARGADARETFARRHGIEPAADLDALLARPDIDAVAIATPSGAHAEPAIAALRAGKHVICEKPLDVTLERIDAMIAAARAADRLLACVLQSRLLPAARTLKEALDAGRFGRLSIVQAATNWWRDEAYYASAAWRGTWRLDGGGALMNQGIHAVDLLQWLVGAPSEVWGRTACRAHAGLEVEDTAMAVLRLPGGALGTLQASTAAWPGAARRIEITGEHGSAVLENDRLAVWRFAHETAEDDAIRAAYAPVAGAAAAGTAQAVAHDGHRLLFEDLVAAVRDGRPPAVDGADARAAVATVLAVYESARSGRPVGLGQIGRGAG